jgi:type II secretory pathway pseudopilin PulG
MSAMTELEPTPRHDLLGERGLTLVELLVTMMIFIGLLAAFVPVFTAVINEEPKISGGAARIGQARALMERMGREVRQAYAVDSASSSQLVFRTYTRHATCGGATTSGASLAATQCRVTYSCAAGACARTEKNPDGSGAGTAVQQVTGLLDNAVFTYSPSAAAPELVEIKLVMPGRSAGEDSITLEDGFEMRNVTLAP